MTPVAVAQRRTGRRPENETLVAQSTETWLSNYLSISLLAGLGANALLGWWWADPLVALLVAALAAKSAHGAWRETHEHETTRAEVRGSRSTKAQEPVVAGARLAATVAVARQGVEAAVAVSRGGSRSERRGCWPRRRGASRLRGETRPEAVLTLTARGAAADHANGGSTWCTR